MSDFSLSGIDPNDPIPGQFREIRFAQGESNISGGNRNVLIIGNKTSAGTETVDTLGTQILDENDVEARFGARSEVAMMYRAFSKIPQQATVYAIAATESGGAAATQPFTFANTSTAATTVKVEALGETIEIPIASGRTATQVGDDVVEGINDHNGGRLPFTAANVAGVVTLTASQKGPHSDFFVKNVRMTITTSAGTTVSKGALGAGSTADDWTSAIAAAEASEFFYIICGRTSTGAVTATDNGIGELIESVKTQALPLNGKDQTVHVALVGTQAQATTTASSAGANSPRAFFYRAEANDLAPGQIAAICCAAVRAKQVGTPAANLADYGLGADDVFPIPDPFTKTDRPTTTEIRADLNNGVTPIAFTPTGRAYIVWLVTSRSLNGTANDYRARPGHIPSVVADFWATLSARYRSQRQPNIADDPAPGQRPIPGFTTPRDVLALVRQVIDEKTGANGESPVTLDPSEREDMKAKVAVIRTNNGFKIRVKPIAVKHNLKSQWLIEESSPSI